MSGVNAISSSNIAFQGKKVSDKKSSPKEHVNKFTGKISNSVKDSFHKKYGEDAKATPKLVADYVADNVIKVGVAVAGAAVLFAKSRKAANGLTEGLVSNWKAARNAADNQKAGILKAGVESVQSTLKQIKRNNLEDAIKEVEASNNSGKSSIRATIVNSIFKPTEEEIVKGSKLESAINFGAEKFSKIAKKFGKDVSQDAVAANISKGFQKVGITKGSQIADVGVAAVSTAALSSGANEITDDVTRKDDKKLATTEKIASFNKALDTLSNGLEIFDKIAG